MVAGGEGGEGEVVVVVAVVVMVVMMIADERVKCMQSCARAYAQNPSFFHASRSPQSQQPPALVLYLHQQASQWGCVKRRGRGLCGT